jgi:adenylosuccinate synthase
LYNVDRLKSRLQASLEAKNVLLQHLYGKSQIDISSLLPQLLEDAEQIKPFVCNTTLLLHTALKQGETILVEGQLGALRDPDHGIYPYSTSSSTLAGFAAIGAGLPPYSIQRIAAIVKAYSSCVGEGPFVSEIAGSEADELRKRGGDAGEYGVNTGRPRRMGWFDAVATKYGCMLQGATEAVLTNLDVLGYLAEIPVCAAYELDGIRITDFPASVNLDRAEPVFDRLPGWLCNISAIHKFAELPIQAQNYVLYVEQQIGVRISCVSVGPKREQMIWR